MKLVDILARELKEWPEGTECASQDPDKEVRFRPGIRFDFYSTRLASDAGIDFGGGAEVTRAQWQAAVDALKAGQQAWDGEGLPPVGLEIEISHRRAQPDWTNPGFYKAVIVAMGAQLMILRADGNGHEKVATIADYHFRPIRTAEQIAAEEHDAAISEMVSACAYPGSNITRHVCEEIYALGYRKQVQP